MTEAIVGNTRYVTNENTVVNSDNLVRGDGFDLGALRRVVENATAAGTPDDSPIAVNFFTDRTDPNAESTPLEVFAVSRFLTEDGASALIVLSVFSPTIEAILNGEVE